MRDSLRQLKRQWLQAAGLLGPDPLLPSTSSSQATPAITITLIDSTLKVIKAHDPLWVASACLDVLTRARCGKGALWEVLQKDAGLVEQLIGVGMEATQEVSNSHRSDCEEPSRASSLSEARVALQISSQRLGVWRRLYPSRDITPIATSDSQSKGVGDDAEEDDDTDAWADVAEITPPPAMHFEQKAIIPLLDFIATKPELLLLQSALANQPDRLCDLLRHLLPSQLIEVFPHRLQIVKALLAARLSSDDDDLEVLLQEEVLPGSTEGRETGIWAELVSGLHYHSDATIEDSTKKTTVNALVSFYTETIVDLSNQYGAIRLASRLADTLQSNLGLSTPEVHNLAQDLHLLNQLVNGNASATSTRTWNLTQFQGITRDANSNSNVADIASQFVVEARNGAELLSALQDGVLPFIKVVHDRQQGSHLSDENQILALMVLQLAQSGHLSIAANILEHGVFTKEQRTRLVLALILGLELHDASQLRLLSSLLDNYIAEGEEQPTPTSLRDQVGALLSVPSADRGCESIFGLLEKAMVPALNVYVGRCRAMLDAMLRMQGMGIHFVTVPWLLDLESNKIKQVQAVESIIRSLSDMYPQAYQYRDLSATLLECAGSGRVFDMLLEEDIILFIVQGAARAGNARIFWEVLESEDDDILSMEAREDIILRAAVDLHNAAPSANLNQGGTKAAFELLQSAPKPFSELPRLQREKAFIEASSRLSSFRVQSAARPGTPISPQEIRDCDDRLQLVERMLTTQRDTYKAAEIVLDLAFKLCALDKGTRDHLDKDRPFKSSLHRSEIECRVLGMLCEAAMAAGDYQTAEKMCEKLTASVAILSKRAEQLGSHSNSEAAQVLHQQHMLACGITHRTCHQMAKQPDWNDFASRLRWAAHALAYCPADQLSRYIEVWRNLARQLEAAMQLDPSTGLVRELLAGDSASPVTNLPLASAAAVGANLSSGLTAALQQARAASSTASASGLGAAGLAALSQFGGSIESYANPLGALFSRAPSALRPLSATSGSQKRAEASTDGVDLRASQLFDGLAATSHGRVSSPSREAENATVKDRTHLNAQAQPVYMDPAERAARAARRFFGGA